MESRPGQGAQENGEERRMMPHDPFYVTDLPITVRYQAEAVLARAMENVDRCVTVRPFAGYVIEAHTMGCRYAAGDADPWEAHWAIFDEYAGDGVSRIMGDPADGAFVTITPERPARTSFLDGVEPPEEGEFTLGERRKKVRIPLERAERIAERVMREVGPLTEFALVAGSVRRREIEVGDIEIVVLPKNVRKFVEALEAMGFVEGGDRIRKGSRDGQKIEIYIAHKPKELGAMILMYTGDFLLNIAMRSKALKLGLHLDQYGLKKDGRYVFQSEDEEDFFEKLNMEWHEPEQRSLGRRSELQKMGRELRALRLSASEGAFIEEALHALRTEKYMPLEDQARFEALYRKKILKKAGLAGGRWSMGAEELIELGDGPKEWSPRGEYPVDLPAWQEAYGDQGGRGTVRNVFAKIDGDSFRLWVEAEEEGGLSYYLPLLQDMPTWEEVAHYRKRPTEWIAEVAPQILGMGLKWDGPYEEAV